MHGVHLIQPAKIICHHVISRIFSLFDISFILRKESAKAKAMIEEVSAGDGH